MKARNCFHRGEQKCRFFLMTLSIQSCTNLPASYNQFCNNFVQTSMSVNLTYVQFDQIGRFFKVLCNNFSYNTSPNIWQLFRQLCESLYFVKFLDIYWNFWLTVNSTSGHTAYVTGSWMKICNERLQIIIFKWGPVGGQVVSVLVFNSNDPSSNRFKEY